MLDVLVTLESSVPRRKEDESEKENSNLLWPFSCLNELNPLFVFPSEMTSAIIYCTLYCIKYVTDITVHLGINIFYVVSVCTTNTNCIV